MMLPSGSITFQEAKDKGYRSLTVRFNLPDERCSLDRAMQDLDKGNVDYVLAGNANAPEIWRKNMKMTVSGEHTEFNP